MSIERKLVAHETGASLATILRDLTEVCLNEMSFNTGIRYFLVQTVQELNRWGLDCEKRGARGKILDSETVYLCIFEARTLLTTEDRISDVFDTAFFETEDVGSLTSIYKITYTEEFSFDNFDLEKLTDEQIKELRGESI